MSTNTVVIGGITSQIPFLITCIITNSEKKDIVYFLNIKSVIPPGQTAAINIYYWEPNLAVIANAGTIPVFTASTTFINGVSSNEVIFFDSTNNGGLGFIIDNNGNVTGDISFALNPSPVQVNLYKYNEWLEPFILLAGVDYQLLTQTSAAAFIPNDKDVLVPSNRVQFIPITWYYSCQGGNCNIINNTLVAAAQWQCNQVAPNSEQPLCSQVTPLVKEAWLNINEASTNIFYNYCTLGNLCGTSEGGQNGNPGCNGPCSVFYYSCTTGGKNEAQGGTFSCSFNSSLFIDDYQWWKDPYFIAVVIFFIFMIIAIVCLIIYWTSNK